MLPSCPIRCGKFNYSNNCLKEKMKITCDPISIMYSENYIYKQYRKTCPLMSF